MSVGIAGAASTSRPEQDERGPGVGDARTTAEPVRRPLDAEPRARRARIGPWRGQRPACLLDKRPVAGAEGECPQFRVLQEPEADQGTGTATVTGPSRGPSVVEVGRAVTRTAAALVLLDAAVADMSGCTAPADFQSRETRQEDIDLHGTCEDVGVVVRLVAVGKGSAEQLGDSTEDAGITGSNQPGSKHTRAAIEHAAVAEGKVPTGKLGASKATLVPEASE